MISCQCDFVLSSQNVGLLGLTRNASRRAVRVAASLMILFSVLGLFPYSKVQILLYHSSSEQESKYVGCMLCSFLSVLNFFSVLQGFKFFDVIHFLIRIESIC